MGRRQEVEARGGGEARPQAEHSVKKSLRPHFAGKQEEQRTRGAVLYGGKGFKGGGQGGHMGKGCVWRGVGVRLLVRQSLGALHQDGGERLWSFLRRY
jgi:hypothetical protein